MAAAITAAVNPEFIEIDRVIHIHNSDWSRISSWLQGICGSAILILIVIRIQHTNGIPRT